MAICEVDVQLGVVVFQAKCGSLLYLAILCLEAAECDTEVNFNLCVSLA